MKKKITFVLSYMLVIIILLGCTTTVSNREEKKIKETIDYVLSYDKGYYENINKKISEVNFYVCNYVTFYSLYLGDSVLEKYESTIKHITKDDGKYTVYMTLDMVAKAKEVHGEEEKKDEAEGKDVPVQIVLSKNSDGYHIDSFKEYESLEKAIESNANFK
ncbi:hypothetical protein [Clostridium chauvoei]|uniref:hypothetical protein n=1 Tax=Clostridium chauvoei TaxID=46867 RepID=UPI001C840BA6|nr:hypothetical protein [Clostridium chauvoei]MBX7408991.1 hypothetical protein [Clostridium chauvoei]